MESDRTADDVPPPFLVGGFSFQRPEATGNMNVSTLDPTPVRYHLESTDESLLFSSNIGGFNWPRVSRALCVTKDTSLP